MTRLFALALLMLVMSCNDQQDEEVTALKPQESRIGSEEPEAYPVMIYDKASSLALLRDCRAGMSSYMCEAIEKILELNDKSPVFAVPRRPRHCPNIQCMTKGDIWGAAPRGGKVPGTVCMPQVCGQLLAENCYDQEGKLTFGVRAISPEYVTAYLMAGDEIIGSTLEEYGGSVRSGLECNSAILDFGVSINDIVKPGFEIHVNTVVNIDGEPVETSFKARL
ncbi:MAG: hypothetical protein WBA74_16770 [Cyclobacteriaceae bacterium]